MHHTPPASPKTMYHPQVPGIPNLVYTEKTQRSEGSSLLTSLQDDLALVAPASPAPSPRQRSRSRSRASAAVAAGTADDVVDLESPAEMPALPSFYVHTFEYGDVARCCMACREFFLPGQLRLGVLLQFLCRVWLAVFRGWCHVIWWNPSPKRGSAVCASQYACFCLRGGVRRACRKSRRSLLYVIQYVEYQHS